jgi:alpha-mannosidase
MEMLPAEGGHPAYLQLMSDTKYGFQGWNGRGELSLLHASFYPDLYPEMAAHHIHAAIAVVRNGEEAQKLGDCYDHELIPVSGKPHKGTLPLTGSMFTVGNIKGISPSGIYVNKDGSLTLRFYNRTDEMKVTTLTFPYKVLSAAYIDLNDNVTAPVLMEDEHTLTLSIDAYATQTINVTLDRA